MDSSPRNSLVMENLSTEWAQSIREFRSGEAPVERCYTPRADLHADDPCDFQLQIVAESGGAARAIECGDGSKRQREVESVSGAAVAGRYGAGACGVVAGAGRRVAVYVVGGAGEDFAGDAEWAI